MKKLCVSILCLSVLLFSLVFASSAFAEQTVITVSTAEEFVNAIGSNTTIILAEGEYNLSEIARGPLSSKDKYWNRVHDGQELIIENVTNLTIQGASPDCRIVVEPRYANVLKFMHCDNIKIENITAGHTPEEGTCSGGVFYFSDCSDIQISNSHMFGCGAFGLSLFDVKGVNVENSSIYECTTGIMRIGDSENITFTNCIFRDTEFSFDAVSISNTTNLTFDHCQFNNNRARFPDSYPYTAMFYADRSSELVAKNTSFIDNHAEFFDWAGLISFENNTYAGNSFDESN